MLTRFANIDHNALYVDDFSCEKLLIFIRFFLLQETSNDILIKKKSQNYLKINRNFIVFSNWGVGREFKQPQFTFCPTHLLQVALISLSCPFSSEVARLLKPGGKESH